MHYQLPFLLPGLPYENIYIKTKDGVKINAVFIKQPANRVRCPLLNYISSYFPDMNTGFYTPCCSQNKILSIFLITTFLSSQLATAPTVIFLHGNAGNVGHRLINAKALHSFCGCNIFLLEWRGFGKSDGLASEYGECMLVVLGQQLY